MLAHCNLKQNLCLCSKQSSLFSFYALPSGGKLKDAMVHTKRSFTKMLSKVDDGFVLVKNLFCNSFLNMDLRLMGSVVIATANHYK